MSVLQECLYPGIVGYQEINAVQTNPDGELEAEKRGSGDQGGEQAVERGGQDQGEGDGIKYQVVCKQSILKYELINGSALQRCHWQRFNQMEV